MSERLAAFTTVEFQQGATDLNGDGDAADEILHVIDMADGSAVNLGLTPAGRSRVVNGRFAFNARESVEGRDLNGDLDLSDDVIHLYDGVRGELQNLGLATLRPAPVIGKSLLAFAVTEAGQNRIDLNGDSDVNDSVLHVVPLVEPTPEELLSGKKIPQPEADELIVLAGEILALLEAAGA